MSKVVFIIAAALFVLGCTTVRDEDVMTPPKPEYSKVAK